MFNTNLFLKTWAFLAVAFFLVTNITSMFDGTFSERYTHVIEGDFAHLIGSMTAISLIYLGLPCVIAALSTLVAARRKPTQPSK
jgi:hypothetical protein